MLSHGVVTAEAGFNTIMAKENASVQNVESSVRTVSNAPR